MSWTDDLNAMGSATVRHVSGAQLEASVGTVFRAASLEGQMVPDREWHIGDLVLANTGTMLSGDGGTGKSLSAIGLAVATLAGTPWLRRSVTQGPALVVSAEDDAAEPQRWLDDFVNPESLSYSDSNDLIVHSLAGHDALLATLDHKPNTLAPTNLWDELYDRVETERPALVVLDTLADLHAGKESERAYARQFVGMLRGLAIWNSCTVLLVARPSLTGMSSGSGMSGSTA